MDPRVKTPPLGLMQQFTLSKLIYDGMIEVQNALQQLRELRAGVKERQSQPGATGDALADFDKKAAALEGSPTAATGGSARGAVIEGPESFGSINRGLNALMGILQGADVAPTTQTVAAVAERRAALAKLMAQWNALKGAELTDLNAKLRAANVPPIAQPRSAPVSDPRH
jgi:hypothetical protein